MLSDTARQLLDYFALVLEIAESEGIDLATAAERAAVEWAELAPPRIEVTPVLAPRCNGIALAA